MVKDREAQQASVHGVTKSQTEWLSNNNSNKMKKIKMKKG